MRRSLIVIALCLTLMGFIGVAAAQQNQPNVPKTPPPADVNKQTTLGNYATALEAYIMYRTGGDKIHFLDVRTPEEYAFVGHAPFAPNIPSKLWTGKFNEKKAVYELADNADFENAVKARFKPEDTIMVMCRSGDRSAAAVNRMAKIGFKNVFSVVDGFEGDKITDEDNYSKGKRVKNGWRNANLPWTYDLDPNLLYTTVAK